METSYLCMRLFPEIMNARSSIYSIDFCNLIRCTGHVDVMYAYMDMCLNVYMHVEKYFCCRYHCFKWESNWFRTGTLTNENFVLIYPVWIFWCFGQLYGLILKHGKIEWHLNRGSGDFLVFASTWIKCLHAMRYLFLYVASISRFIPSRDDIDDMWIHSYPIVIFYRNKCH